MLSVQITEHCGYHSGKGYCAVFRSVVLHVFLRIGVLVLMGPFCTLNKLPYLTLPTFKFTLIWHRLAEVQFLLLPSSIF